MRKSKVVISGKKSLSNVKVKIPKSVYDVDRIQREFEDEGRSIITWIVNIFRKGEK